MAYRDGFTRVEGHPHSRRHLVGATQTIALNDLVQYKEASGSIILGVTNVEILGASLETNVANATTPILVDIFQSGDLIDCKVGTGTMAATEIGEEADIADEDALTLTESNNDVLIQGWNRYDTDQCYASFKNLAEGAA